MTSLTGLSGLYYYQSTTKMTSLLGLIADNFVNNCYMLNASHIYYYSNNIFRCAPIEIGGRILRSFKICKFHHKILQACILINLKIRKTLFG